MNFVNQVTSFLREFYKIKNKKTQEVNARVVRMLWRGGFFLTSLKSKRITQATKKENGRTNNNLHRNQR
jgi:hypothetical protein